MNKTEAAAFIGVSTRALERYAAAGKLAAHYVRGKTGQVLAFDEAELQRFKAELEAPTDKPRQEPSRALAKLDGAVNAGAIEVLARLVEAANIGATRPDKARPPVPVEAKLLLTRAEAQAMTGLSWSTLSAAIVAGELKERRLGKAFRIKRADLEKFVGGL
jgi:excisionase family DNA binding protein